MFYLRVLDPPKITVHPVNSSVELDGKIKLYCNATGDPQPSFKWYKNGIAMVEASGVKPFNLSLLWKMRSLKMKLGITVKRPMWLAKSDLTGLRCKCLVSSRKADYHLLGL